VPMPTLTARPNRLRSLDGLGLKRPALACSARAARAKVDERSPGILSGFEYKECIKVVIGSCAGKSK